MTRVMLWFLTPKSNGTDLWEYFVQCKIIPELKYVYIAECIQLLPDGYCQDVQPPKVTHEAQT
jgi:hypothetical protein